jgi:hypothetical protein
MGQAFHPPLAQHTQGVAGVWVKGLEVSMALTQSIERRFARRQPRAGFTITAAQTLNPARMLNP